MNRWTLLTSFYVFLMLVQCFCIVILLGQLPPESRPWVVGVAALYWAMRGIQRYVEKHDEGG